MSMATLLRIVGGLGALLGAANIVFSFSFILNVALFVLPGLVAYAIGTSMSIRQEVALSVPRRAEGRKAKTNKKRQLSAALRRTQASERWRELHRPRRDR
jgi:hypothetical protein